jgi:polyisoprenoid-binding protein YceI
LLQRFLAVALLVPAALGAQGSSRQTQAGAAADPSAPATYAIDVSHSELTFEIRHFVSRVRGNFKDWKGTVVADPADWSKSAAVDVTIQTATISTNNDRRDADLRSSNFFAADSFPQITFKSTKVERKGDAIKVHGNLTMRGVTKPVVLDGQFLGAMKAANGRDRLGFEATTTIDRRDYGIVWNRAAEGGGAMLGDEVKISIAIAAVKQPPAAPAP